MLSSSHRRSPVACLRNISWAAFTCLVVGLIMAGAPPHRRIRTDACGHFRQNINETTPNEIVWRSTEKRYVRG